MGSIASFKGGSTMYATSDALIEETRTCQRCRGLMVFESVNGHEQQLSILRCLNCGEVIDEQIVENRVQEVRRPR